MSYKYIEFGGLKNDIFYRKIWISTQEELTKCRNEFNNKDVYVTVWHYEKPDKDSPCDAPLYLDLDNQDLDKALSDAKTLCDILLKNFFIPHQFMKIRFSGANGFHILVDGNVFDLPQHVVKSKLYKFLAIKLNHYIGSIDTKIYDTSRLFRLLNSINGKTNLYKIPLTYDELYNMDYILYKAENPIPPSNPNGHICFLKKSQEALMSIWEEYKAGETKKNVAFEKPPCIRNIEKGVGKGERNVAMMALALYYKNAKFKKDEILKKIFGWNMRNAPKITSEEVRKTVDSVISNEYSLGCSTPILIKYCEKDKCKIKREV